MILKYQFFFYAFSKEIKGMESVNLKIKSVPIKGYHYTHSFDKQHFYMQRQEIGKKLSKS